MVHKPWGFAQIVVNLHCFYKDINISIINFAYFKYQL